MTVRIGLVGAGGYGLAHRRVITELQEIGTAELVGLCDLVPVRSVPGAPVPASARIFTDVRELLVATAPDVVVVAAPPHTHLEVAMAAVQAGADVLIEKPPLLSIREHATLASELESAGRVCQVGFQALGSQALVALIDAVRAGRLGEVIGIGAYGAWNRPDSYYQRAPWAGRRRLAGRPVLDGAIANPFGHALMQSLAVAGAVADSRMADIEVERYRARPIEVDDTGAVRVRLHGGPPVLVAVTLCADEITDPVVVVTGERGRAELAYTSDRLRLPGDTGPVPAMGRERLLDNLLAHRQRPDEVPLIAPLSRTAPFTAVVESVAAAEPVAIDRAYRRAHGHGPDRIVTVPGVAEVVRRSAECIRLPTELGTPWADEAAISTWEGVQIAAGQSLV
jgi:predicted dehydrogenase